MKLGSISFNAPNFGLKSEKKEGSQSPLTLLVATPDSFEGKKKSKKMKIFDNTLKVMAGVLGLSTIIGGALIYKNKASISKKMNTRLEEIGANCVERYVGSKKKAFVEGFKNLFSFGKAKNVAQGAAEKAAKPGLIQRAKETLVKAKNSAVDMIKGTSGQAVKTVKTATVGVQAAEKEIAVETAAQAPTMMQNIKVKAGELLGKVSELFKRG